MNDKVQLWKKYGDGDVRPLSVKNTKQNMEIMLLNGYFLTEEEAKTGKVKPAAKKAPAKK